MKYGNFLGFCLHKWDNRSEYINLNIWEIQGWMFALVFGSIVICWYQIPIYIGM